MKLLAAYAAWLAGVAAMGAIAVAWYRHVEGIGWAEVAKRLQETRVDDGAR